MEREDLSAGIHNIPTEIEILEEPMRKTRKLRLEWLGIFAALTFLLVLITGLFGEGFHIISHAEEGTVSVTAATIRKEADVSSEAIGSVVQGKTITINSEVTGSDGMVWYQVNVNSTTVGYIRSDLVRKSGDGGTATPPAVNPSVEVADVQPQSASVVGEQVRIRADASSSGSIVTTVRNDVVLTVTGQATGTDGNLWYRVTFMDNGTEVTGFVRNDYVTLTGELVPADGGTPSGEGGEGQPETTAPEPDISQQPYAIEQVGEDWFLLNYEAEQKYKITELLTAGEENGKLYEAAQKTVKGQKIAIIILVILLVAAILVATMLFLKVKDVMDEAYFSAVEKETIRERNSAKEPGRYAKKVMQTVGQEPERPVQAGKSRASGVKNQTGVKQKAVSPQQQSRQGAVRQQGGGQVRPSEAQNQQSRQNQTAKTQSRPGGASPAGQSHVPAGQDTATPRKILPQGKPFRQGDKTQGAAQNRSAVPQGQQARRGTGIEQPNPGWKSKNFMTDDDDEFEFEFLNWDGEENQ